MKVAFRKFIPLIVAVSVGNFPTLVEAQLLSGVWPVKPPAPPAPPAQHQTGEKMERQSVAAEFYTVGDVTDEEQLYVEFINRARANPQAEAQLMANTTNPLVLQAYAHPRHGGYGVDLEMMLQAFALIPPVPPLALNARLNNAARKHSQDMLDQNLQTHTGSNGSSIGQRIEAEGYDWVNIAENVYAFSDSVEYGHFGFEVDWGPNPPSGMQDPPGHRLNIHNPVFKEIGVGMVYGQKPRTNMFSGVGPSLVSQEFATAQNSPAFVTGVVYYDFNGNNVYDVGEGLGNIQVSAAGVSTKAITAPSGGYSLPIPTDGVFTITFSGPGLPATIRSAIILNRQNVKIDFVPAYKEPIIQGPAEPLIGKGNIYTATDVAGGVSYQWSTFTRLPAVPSEGAENTNNITFNTPTNYVAVDASISKSGSRSFHLSHLEQLSPDQQVKDISQSFEVNNIMLARANSQVRFQSRLGFATTNQIARVLASSDNGQTWVPVYSQPGSMGSGEAGFNLRTASLSQFAGKLIRVRFSYDLEIGLYYPGFDLGVGWYVDDISIEKMELATQFQTYTTDTPTLVFNPSSLTAFGMQVTPKNLARTLPGSMAKVFQPKMGATEMKITSVTRISASQAQVDFELLYGAVPASFSLQASSTVTGPFTNQEGVIVTPLGNGKYRILTPLPARAFGSNRFFRVVVNP